MSSELCAGLFFLKTNTLLKECTRSSDKQNLVGVVEKRDALSGDVRRGEKFADKVRTAFIKARKEPNRFRLPPTLYIAVGDMKPEGADNERDSAKLVMRLSVADGTTLKESQVSLPAELSS